MRPVRFELREIRLPLREVFEISSGARQNRRILLLRVDGEGASGWGECVAAEDPGYSYETTETAWHVLTEFLIPPLLGHEMMGPEEILAPVEWVRGHRMARASVEMAVWDLHARLLGMPLWELLGGRGEAVSVGVSVGLQPDTDTLLRKVEAYLEEGYARIKIKIKPGRDVEMMRAVRDRFPDTLLMADANSAYTLDDRARLKELDGLALTMIEQPLGHEDILEHALLQDDLATPICLDESIRSANDTRLALELDATRVINIKPGRVGPPPTPRHGGSITWLASGRFPSGAGGCWSPASAAHTTWHSRACPGSPFRGTSPPRPAIGSGTSSRRSSCWPRGAR